MFLYSWTWHWVGVYLWFMHEPDLCNQSCIMSNVYTQLQCLSPTIGSRWMLLEVIVYGFWCYELKLCSVWSSMSVNKIPSNFGVWTYKQIFFKERLNRKSNFVPCFLRRWRHPCTTTLLCAYPMCLFLSVAEHVQGVAMVWAVIPEQLGIKANKSISKRECRFPAPQAMYLFYWGDYGFGVLCVTPLYKGCCP